MNTRPRTREWAGVDFYAELGVTAVASAAAVDEAYRRQAKALHPDRNPEATAEEGFKRLTAAYEVLRDPVTRELYDDFRHRVDAGTLSTSPSRPSGSSVAGTPGYAPAPGMTRRARRPRRTMPDGVRKALGYVLIALGAVAVLWATLGDLPSHTAGDSNLAVQITLGIMALKLIACGVVVIKYPQLKARWHRPPDARTAQGTTLPVEPCAT